MDQQSQQLILDNVRTQVASRWSQMVTELRSYGDQDLSTFLRESGIELPDVLRQGSRSWTELRRDAGLPTPAGTQREPKLLKRGRAFAHVDDAHRAQGYDRLLRDGAPPYEQLPAAEQRLARMLFFSVWPDGGGHESYEAGLAVLRGEAAVRHELRSVVDFAFEAARHPALQLDGRLADTPLRVHARYQREEILSALEYADLTRKPTSVMQGVAYSQALNADILFVTLKKSEADYSPTTMYRDYPINPTLFHWESQSTTSVASPTGQRYVTGSSSVLLFVREEQKDEFGTAPYLFLGPARYVSHVGERPIAIRWRLKHPMPSEFFNSATVAAN